MSHREGWKERFAAAAEKAKERKAEWQKKREERRSLTSSSSGGHGGHGGGGAGSQTDKDKRIAARKAKWSEKKVARKEKQKARKDKRIVKRTDRINARARASGSTRTITNSSTNPPPTNQATATTQADGTPRREGWTQGSRGQNN